MHYVLITSTGWAHDTFMVELLAFSLYYLSPWRKIKGSRVFMFSHQLFNCPSFNAAKDAMEDPIGLLAPAPTIVFHEIFGKTF